MSTNGPQAGPERLARGAGAVLLWLVVWQVAALAVGSDLILAGPLQTLTALAALVRQGAFWGRVVWSLVRIAGGFLAAFALANVLATSAWRHPLIEQLLHPAMLAIKSTPVVCIVVLLLIWFGSRVVSAVSVFLVALPAIYFSALEALRSLDSQMLEMLEVHRVPRTRQMLGFVWPSMQPFLLATCKMVVGMSWKAGVAAELIGTPAGSIGERIYQSKILLETADLFAWTIVVVVAAWLCERGFLALLGASGRWTMRRAVPKAEHGAQRFGAATLVLEDVSLAFDGRPVLAGVSHLFSRGSRTCLRDPSGAGKTTVLRLLAGLQRADSGRVSGGRVSVVPQESVLVEDMDAAQNVLFMAGENASAQDVREMLAAVLPAEALKGTVRELSGGQRRRVELVRALACASEAVLMDEPFASLDDVSRATAAQLVLDRLAGRTLVVATHNEEDAQLLDADAVRLLA